MANSIALATKFQPILDAIYKAASLTARLDGPTLPVSFAGANVVKVFKTSMVGMGNYSRANGYSKGDVTGAWETLTLATERSRELFIDRMDDEETLGMAFGTLVGEFMRTQVIPEVDAYRFATISGWSSVGAATPGTLSASTVLAAFDAAMQTMDDAEVPPDGRVLFVSAAVNTYLKEALTRLYGNVLNPDRRVTNLDNVEVIPVPQSRFGTAVTLNAGSTTSAGGFTETGKDINFLLVHPSAILQVKKHDNLKVFDPDVNQSSDGWKIQYRLYHDCFVYDNKLAGVYVHHKA